MRNVLLLSLAALATASQAAETLKISSLTFGGNTDIVHLGGVMGLNDGYYYAGPFDASLDGGSAIRVFCADLLHETAFNADQAVSVVDTATLGAGYQKAAQLYNKFDAGIGDDKVENAALQAAIWKSIFPTVAYNDYNTGTAIKDQADLYLATDLTGVSNHANYYSLGDANQSMLGFSPQAVPEPTSVAALAVGALGLLRRKRVR